MSSNPTETQRVQIRPAYQKWWTLKVLMPFGHNVPNGQKTDEWCATFCSQTVGKRAKNLAPSCRTVCIRKVFPHEVRNVLSYQRHSNIGADGKAKYPLPPEGQAENLPRILRGLPSLSPDEAESSSSASGQKKDEQRYWDEGWYFWTNDTMSGSIQRLNGMTDIKTQVHREKSQQEARELWKQYQAYLERRRRIDQDPEAPLSEQDKRWQTRATPLGPPGDVSSRSLLVPMPPDFAVFERIRKFLQPTHHVLSLLTDNYRSGHFKDFSLRMWEKARTDEPFVLARNACRKFIETMNEGGSDDDESDSENKRPR